MFSNRILLAVATTVFLLLLIPVFALYVGITIFPSLGTTSFSFWTFITMRNTQVLVENTLEFSVVSAALTTILATSYAWFVTRTDVYGKRFLELLPVLGLSVPLLFKAFAWSFLLNPHAGIINTTLRGILGRGAPVLDINTMAGLIFVMSFTNVPIVYLVILPAMKSMDSTLEEASRIAGKSILTTFRNVTFPLARPAVLSAFLLAVLGGVGNFEYPFILGVPGNIHVLATEVYFWAQERVPPAYGTAGEISILYSVIALAGVSAYIWSTRRSFKYQVVTGRSVSKNVQKLGRFKYLALLICLGILFFEFVLPFTTLFLMSTTTIYGSEFSSIKLNFPSSYLTAFQIPSLFQSLETSFLFGIIAATLATVVGALLAYSALKTKARGGRFAEYISAIPLAFPGVVYGVALFWTFLLAPGFNLIYGTIWPLVIALVFIRLPFSTRIVSGNLVQVSDELEEASQVAGAGFFRTFTRVIMPLIKNGLFNSLVYTFVDSLRELGGVIILTTAQTTTFTVLLLHYYNTSTLFSSIDTVAAASVVFTGIIATLMAAAALVRRYWGGKWER
ncbi:MAG TPA: iron ABC transporter permease [Nitrososphaerales archaeon]|nr:iron ABC transporter permease [Nitrososphaerales archaeon]